MYSNLSKSQALPMALRLTSPKPSKIWVYPKPLLNPNSVAPCCGLGQSFQSLKPSKISFSFGGFCVGFAIPRSKLGGGIRVYSNMSRPRRNLPWLNDNDGVGNVVVGDLNRNEKFVKSKPKSKPKPSSNSSSGSKSPWEISAEKFLQKSGSSSVQDEVELDWRNPPFERGDNVDEYDRNDAINEPRHSRIRTRVRPQLERWNRQENWGRKTYREAQHESTLPKMVGEGVYGVGPVLAALCAGRREFYTLFVQEGLENSTKMNKKRKDKKGFEKVLKIADRIGLTIKEISKHDLNMISDNRPHQGLVLDASPLEMVNIKELDPVSEQDTGLLWVALDEVTDPQNLGAIVRSSYFFGASGVVLCAKNSAPLSGVVSKASAGSLELMEVRSCKNMMQFLTSCAQNGWRVVGGSVSSRAVPLREVGPGEPTVLVLGSEGTGLRPLVERSCTQLVRIPGNIPIDVSSGRVNDDEEMEGQSSGEELRAFMAVESLNVSVAAGVLLHHFIGNNVSDYVPGDVETGDVETEDLDQSQDQESL